MRLVQEIHPIGDDSPRVQSHLEAAEAFGIVTKTLDGPDPTYSFTDSVTRDQLYRLLLFAQKRRLHRAVAEWYERAYGDDLAPHFSTLAGHWYASEDRQKAGRYCELAANHASAQGFPTRPNGSLEHRSPSPPSQTVGQRTLHSTRPGRPASRSRVDAYQLMSQKEVIVPTLESSRRTPENKTSMSSQSPRGFQWFAAARARIAHASAKTPRWMTGIVASYP